MYNLMLYDHPITSTESYRANITDLAHNWRRSIRALGGFWMGEFTISPMDMSRYWLIDFYNSAIGMRVMETGYGITTWEGEIVQLRLTLDGVTWLRSLDPERWRNKVKIIWGGGETAWGEDTDSSDMYGESCYIDQGSAIYDADSAEIRCDTIIDHDAFPRSHPESGLIIDPEREAEADGLSVLCAGYVFSMNRRYQETNIAAGNVSAQIGTLVGNSEFVTTGSIETNATQSAVIVAGTPMRLWDAIQELVEIGDASGNEYVGGVYADREFDYAAAETAVTHYWRGGRLYDAAGYPVQPTHVRPDIIVEIANAPHSHEPPGGTVWDKPNRAYIDEVEFAAPDKLALIPRTVREPTDSLNDMTRRVIGYSDKYAAFRHAVSAFSNLPGLRGLWTMADYDTSGNAEDQTNYDLLLTRNGNPMYNYDGLVPYLDFDGTGDYLSRADEAALDITGTEGHITAAVRGLTMGGWFKFDDDTPAGAEYVMSKMGAAGNYSYRLVHDATGTCYFSISDDGTNFDNVQSTATTSGWTFILGRFVPSTTVDIWINNTKASAAAGVGASVFSGNGPFNVCGYNNGTAIYSGLASVCFLCASALPDDMIGALFQQSRALYGV